MSTRFGRALSIFVILATLSFSVAPLAAEAAGRGSGTRGALFVAKVMKPSVVRRSDGNVSAAESESPAEYIKGRYLVFFTDDVIDPLKLADELGAKFGFIANYVYLNKPAGFAAKIDTKALDSVQNDPRVTSVLPVGLAHSDATPNGIKRIGTMLNANADIDGNDDVRVDADVVVMDSGVQRNHPDLNFQGGYDCYGSTSDGGYDQQGHGTHIAGTIGALDNGFGVVGVAPGVRIWSIKIGGTGSFPGDAIYCGYSVILSNSWLDVVNMSFGASAAWTGCSGDAFDSAICAIYDQGTTLVAAAGNESQDVSNSRPANSPKVIAVSAIADSDGRIGGVGGTVYDQYDEPYADDSFATFSNYGAGVDIAAPGVAILSTWPGSSYNSIDGTSMASPHVAGAAALYIAKNGRVGPASVLIGLKANSDKAPILGDYDGYAEPVLYVGDLNPSCSLSPTSGPKGKTVNVSCTKFRANEKVRVRWSTASGTTLKTLTAGNSGSASGSFTVPNSTTGSKKVYIKGLTSGRQITKSFTVTSGSASIDPTKTPTPTPTAQPTTPVATATSVPTQEPTVAPTEVPTQEPTATAAPPTEVPTESPVPTVEATQPDPGTPTP